MLQNVEPVFRLLGEAQTGVAARGTGIRLVCLELDERRAPGRTTSRRLAHEMLRDVPAAGIRQNEEIDDTEAARSAPRGKGPQSTTSAQ